MGRVSVKTTVDRLLVLLGAVDRGESLTIASVMQMTEVKRKGAKRYIEWLEKLRPLQEQKEGRGKSWSLSEEQGDLEKAAALQMAEIALKEMEGTPVFTKLHQIALKAMNDLEDGDRDRLARLSKSFHILRPETLIGARSASLTCISDAIRKRKRIRFNYHTLKKQTGTYKVEPWSLVLHQGRVMLLAGKIETSGCINRLFNLDRMEAIEMLAEGCKHREMEPQLFWRDAFGLYAGEDMVPEWVHLRVRGTHAQELRFRRVHFSQMAETSEDGWLDVRMRVAICEEFKSFVMGMVPNVRIVEPQSLREEIAKRMSQWITDHGPK